MELHNAKKIVQLANEIAADAPKKNQKNAQPLLNAANEHMEKAESFLHSRIELYAYQQVVYETACDNAASNAIYALRELI